VFADRGLTRRSWDALAALRRVGEPYRLAPTELCQDLMRTSGAITHTLHRLEYAGLVERLVNPEDGRSLYVALTPRALELDTIAPLHLDNERRLLTGLTPDEQHTLAHLLRKLLLSFERDRAAPTPRPGGQAARAPQGVTTRRAAHGAAVTPRRMARARAPLSSLGQDRHRPVCLLLISAERPC
jgi:DNA-binding MarR family transcriptional regulator